MITIAIDIGASFLKGARISSDGAIEAYVEKDAAPSPEETGLKIERTLEAVRKLLEELAECHQEYTLAISTEMHGFIIADEQGRPMTDYVSWQTEYGNNFDENGETFFAGYCSLAGADWVRRTGMPARAGLPSVNLYFLLKTGRLNDAGSGKVYFYTLGDYLIRKLTGTQPVIHTTNAAATGLYDVVGSRWCKEIIRAIGADGIIFPEVVADNRSAALNIEGKAAYILPAIGDQQAALLGSGLAKESELSVNFGTGAQISVLTDKAELSDQYQLRPFFGGKYLKTIPHIPSGRALNVYIRFIREIAQWYGQSGDDVWELVAEKTQAGQDGSLALDMGFFSNPVSKGTRGSIGNIGEEDFSVGNLFSSAFRTMAENVQSLYPRLGLSQPRKLIFSGGVARKNRLFREQVIKYFNPTEGYTVAEQETMKGLFLFAKTGRCDTE